MPYIIKKLPSGGEFKIDRDSAKRFFGKQERVDEDAWSKALKEMEKEI